MGNKAIRMGVLVFVLFLLVNTQVVFSYDSGFGDKDVSFCDAITGDSKYNCYADVAEHRGDVGICEKITGEGWIEEKRNWCYERVAKTTQDETICERISLEKYPKEEINEKQNCIKNVALAKEDVKLCDNLLNLPFRDVCYHELAEKINNSGICEKISYGNYIRDVCFSNIAKETKNDDICEKISDGDIKSDCFKETTPLRTGLRSWMTITLISLIFTLLLLSDIALIKRSGLKNKSIWLGLTLGGLIGLGLGSYTLLPNLIYGAKFSLIGFVLITFGYTLIGLLIALLISKVRNPIIFGLIVGFLIPFILFLSRFFLPFSFGLKVLRLYTGPLISGLGLGGWAGLAIAMYAAPFVYAIIGCLIGLIYLLIRKFLQRSENNKYWSILIFLLLLIVFLIKPANLGISHDIPSWIVNPVTTARTIIIEQNILFYPFISFEKVTIEQNGKIIGSWDIPNSKGLYRGHIKLIPVKIRVDPNKLFNNNFKIGKKQTSSINVYYSQFGRDYKTSQDFTMEVKPPLPKPPTLPPPPPKKIN